MSHFFRKFFFFLWCQNCATISTNVWHVQCIESHKKYKPISCLEQDLQKRYYSSIHIDPKFTLVLDDKLYTFAENPDNGVLIPPFSPGDGQQSPTLKQLLDVSDTALLQFITWLQKPEVLNSKDYSKLPKDFIFT